MSEGMKQEVIQQTREIVTSGLVGGGSIVAGIATVAGWLSPILGCITAIAGIILSTFLMFKAYSDIKVSQEKRKYTKILRKEIEQRRKDGLSLERHTDLEILEEGKKEK